MAHPGSLRCLGLFTIPTKAGRRVSSICAMHEPVQHASRIDVGRAPANALVLSGGNTLVPGVSRLHFVLERAAGKDWLLRRESVTGRVWMAPHGQMPASQVALGKPEAVDGPCDIWCAGQTGGVAFKFYFEPSSSVVAAPASREVRNADTADGVEATVGATASRQPEEAPQSLVYFCGVVAFHADTELPSDAKPMLAASEQWSAWELPAELMDWNAPIKDAGVPECAQWSLRREFAGHNVWQVCTKHKDNVWIIDDQGGRQPVPYSVMVRDGQAIHVGSAERGWVAVFVLHAPPVAFAVPVVAPARQLHVSESTNEAGHLIRSVQLAGQVDASQLDQLMQLSNDSRVHEERLTIRHAAVGDDVLAALVDFVAKRPKLRQVLVHKCTGNFEALLQRFTARLRDAPPDRVVQLRLVECAIEGSESFWAAVCALPLAVRVLDLSKNPLKIKLLNAPAVQKALRQWIGKMQHCLEYASEPKYGAPVVMSLTRSLVLAQRAADGFERYTDAPWLSMGDDDYQALFHEKGDRKAQDVLHALGADTQLTPQQLHSWAIVSVGGAHGGELEYLLRHSAARFGILVEYSACSARHAQNTADALRDELGKTMVVLRADALEAKGMVRQCLVHWRATHGIDSVLVTCQSVLHELPKRSPGFSPQAFFDAYLDTDVMKCMAVYFYAREPCRPLSGWPMGDARVRLSIEKLNINALQKLALHLQMRNGADDATLRGPVEVNAANALELPATLALETIFKAGYWGGELHLVYELGEQLTSFDVDDYERRLLQLGAWRTSRVFLNTGSFRALYSQVTVTDTNGAALGLPTSHVQLCGYRQGGQTSSRTEKVKSKK